jgi:hypothetical protein
MGGAYSREAGDITGSQFDDKTLIRDIRQPFRVKKKPSG